MNQIFAGTIGLLVALIIWRLGRRSRKSRSKKPSSNYFLGLNQNKIGFQKPKTTREKANMLLEIRQLMTQGPEKRFLAISIAAEWGDRSILPFLKKGLHDTNADVVMAAAAALTKHKNNSLKNQSAGRRKLPPRNVALMR